jgi:hypothetical protein
MPRKKLAGEIFRRLLRPGDVPVTDVVEACDFLDGTGVDRADAEMIYTALAALLGSNPSPEITGLVAFALGKKQDPILLGLFDRALDRILRDLRTCNYALYQCLIAIDNIEPVFQSGSASIRDVRNNIDAADRRLAARGRECQEVGRSSRRQSQRPRSSPPRDSPRRYSSRRASTTTSRTSRTPTKSSRRGRAGRPSSTGT